LESFNKKIFYDTDKTLGKTCESHYQFKHNDEALASLFIDYKSNSIKVLATINGESFIIKETNLWKNQMDVTNSQNNTIVPEKWYSGNF
jgi:hypothetical protein